jgi:DNA-directed RNA polymerase sigma subunit (sigma70/sigma32)
MSIFDLTKYTAEELESLFDKCEFDQRTRDILILRFGLFGNPMRTLEEVGGRFYLTRERVRQVEARAMATLRDVLTHES